jgi:hypothetical protein
MCNAKFGPHPVEIIRSHGIIVVAMAAGLILKKLNDAGGGAGSWRDTVRDKSDAVFPFVTLYW